MNKSNILHLWNTYNLPEYKRNHSRLVAMVSVWFAKRLMERMPKISINIALLEPSALLHDIDKVIPRENDEHHPDTGVRILKKEGLSDIADLVRTHPLHAILDQNIAPKTLEERILYLSDKMVKQDIITVDERFSLWRAKNLPKSALLVLDQAYPKVKALEWEICEQIGVHPKDVARLVKQEETSTMNV